MQAKATVQAETTGRAEATVRAEATTRADGARDPPGAPEDGPTRHELGLGPLGLGLGLHEPVPREPGLGVAMRSAGPKEQELH